MRPRRQKEALIKPCGPLRSSDDGEKKPETKKKRVRVRVMVRVRVRKSLK